MNDKVTGYLIDKLVAAEAEISRLHSQLLVPRDEPRTQVAPTSTYLGDAVYVHRDSRGYLVLQTTNGYVVENQIFLEPQVYEALKRYSEPPPKPAPEPIYDTYNCPHCGEVTVSEEEYNRQLANTGLPWHCPTCKSIDGDMSLKRDGATLIPEEAFTSSKPVKDDEDDNIP